ncbi:hypothetical protein PsYK624_113080 [Phanerochaete sordida]|uniref:Uncharacterized protein n=1 Tax=Phanerochaete sordida TaxID=48140 RepID=A0A9P3LIG3_9APHY|nr:hypothetical protein PsYK624_113080 [Phanerochaete sordida]
MVTILLQGFVVLAMVASVFTFVEEDVNLDLAQYKTVPCYLALFILAEIFELLMAFDALRLRNVIQLVGILAFHVGLIVFASIQIHETKAALVGNGQDKTWHKVLPFLIVSPCILGASLLALMWWIRALYFEFGWAIFHVVGANPQMKTMYQFYQIMICLLKFDFFCFIGVTSQLLIVVLQKNSAEFGLTIAAIPVVLFLLAGAGVAVQREIKWLMSVSLALMLAAETYFYKLVRFYEPSSREQYQTTRATLTVFTIVAFLLLFATFAVGLRCFADFDKGLQSSKTHDITRRRKKVYSSAPVSHKLGADDDAEAVQYDAGGRLQPRISIE